MCLSRGEIKQKTPIKIILLLFFAAFVKALPVFWHQSARGLRIVSRWKALVPVLFTSDLHDIAPTCRRLITGAWHKRADGASPRATDPEQTALAFPAQVVALLVRQTRTLTSVG